MSRMLRRALRPFGVPLAALVAALATAAPAAAASSVSYHPSLTGNTTLHPGDWLSAGLYFDVDDSSNQAVTIGFLNPVFSLPVSCSASSSTPAPGSPITVNLDNGPFDVAASSGKATQPTSSQTSAGSYSAAIRVPDLCNGGTMYSDNAVGPEYVTIDDLQATALEPIQFQLHYVDGGTTDCSNLAANPDPGLSACAASKTGKSADFTPSVVTTPVPVGGIAAGLLLALLLAGGLGLLQLHRLRTRRARTH